MLTDNEILTKLQETNPSATIQDVFAFRRFMRCFDCEDAETFEEADEKINASMEDIGNELDTAENDEEAFRILDTRYRKL